MRNIAALALVLYQSGLAKSIAVPNEASQLQRRANKLGSQGNPFQVQLKCTGVENVCEADAISMLCFGAPHVVIYMGNGGENRKQSGASKQVFTKGEDLLLDYGIDIDDRVMATLGKSMEETVFASSYEGGRGDIIVPVDAKENKDHGTKAIKSGLVTAASEAGLNLEDMKEAYYVKLWTGLSSKTPRASAWMEFYKKLQQTKSKQQLREMHASYIKAHCITNDKMDPVNNAYMRTETGVKFKKGKGKNLKVQDRDVYYHHMIPGRDGYIGIKGWSIDPKTGRDINHDPNIAAKQKAANIFIGAEALQ